MNISEDEIQKAEAFFNQNNVSILENQARLINTAQPNFTATVLAMEKDGLSRDKVEDLLETIFVVYYIQTVLRKKHLNLISIGQIAKNIKAFESFITFYIKERASDDAIDLSKIKFLKDEVVLLYAANTLMKLFGKVSNIPSGVFCLYFALLKGIEVGAEKE